MPKKMLEFGKIFHSFVFNHAWSYGEDWGKMGLSIQMHSPKLKVG